MVRTKSKPQDMVSNHSNKQLTTLSHSLSRTSDVHAQPLYSSSSIASMISMDGTSDDSRYERRWKEAKLRQDELERTVTTLESRLSKRDALVNELENQVRSDQLRYCKENANYRKKNEALQDKCNDLTQRLAYIQQEFDQLRQREFESVAQHTTQLVQQHDTRAKKIQTIFSKPLVAVVEKEMKEKEITERVTSTRDTLTSSHAAEIDALHTQYRQQLTIQQQEHHKQQLHAEKEIAQRDGELSSCRDEISYLYEYLAVLTKIMEKIDQGSYPIEARCGIRQLRIPEEERAPLQLRLERCPTLRTAISTASSFAQRFNLNLHLPASTLIPSSTHTHRIERYEPNTNTEGNTCAKQQQQEDEEDDDISDMSTTELRQHVRLLKQRERERENNNTQLVAVTDTKTDTTAIIQRLQQQCASYQRQLREEARLRQSLHIAHQAQQRLLTSHGLFITPSSASPFASSSAVVSRPGSAFRSSTSSTPALTFSLSRPSSAQPSSSNSGSASTLTRPRERASSTVSISSIASAPADFTSWEESSFTSSSSFSTQRRSSMPNRQRPASASARPASTQPRWQ